MQSSVAGNGGHWTNVHKSESEKQSECESEGGVRHLPLALFLALAPILFLALILI